MKSKKSTTPKFFVGDVVTTIYSRDSGREDQIIEITDKSVTLRKIKHGEFGSSDKAKIEHTFTLDTTIFDPGLQLVHRSKLTKVLG